MQKVEIIPELGRRPSVIVDGVNISIGLVGVDVRLRPDEIPQVDLQLLGDIQPLDLQAQVSVSTDVAEALIAIGWTPPSGFVP